MPEVACFPSPEPRPADNSRRANPLYSLRKESLSADLTNMLMSAASAEDFLRDHSGLDWRSLAELKSSVDHLIGADLRAATRLVERREFGSVDWRWRLAGLRPRQPGQDHVHSGQAFRGQYPI